MLFKSTLKVTAAKRFNNTVDGKHYDTTTVFYEVDMPDNDDHIGQVTESIKWGTHVNLEKLRGLSTPFYADCTLQQVSTGNKSTLIMIDCVPQKQTLPNQAQKPA